MSTEAPKPKTSAKQVSDPEIKALAEIDEILSEIDDEEALSRIVMWLCHKYSVLHTEKPVNASGAS